MKSHGNSDLKLLEHTIYHAYNSLVTCHILACALGYAENNGRLQLLRGEKNRLCPFEVVNVELTYPLLINPNFLLFFLQILLTFSYLSFLL